MCNSIPSVTLWGTTRFTTTTTILRTETSLIPLAPTLTTRLSVVTVCVDTANCGPATRLVVETVTPQATSLAVQAQVVQTEVTNVIPVQTRYYPCPATANPSLGPNTNTDIGQAVSTATPSSTDSAPSSSVTDQSGVGAQNSNNSAQSISTASPEPVSGTGREKNAQSTISDSDPDSTTSRSRRKDNPSSTSMSVSGSNYSASNVTPGQLPASTSSGHAVPPGAIAGIVVGSLVGIVAIVFIFLCWRRRRQGRSGSTVGGGTGGYWERRSAALDGVGKDEEDTEKQPVEQRRMSLNLASEVISTRAPSRLSQISSFFRHPLGGGGGGDRNAAASASSGSPSRLSFKFRKRVMSRKLNFSRPLRPSISAQSVALPLTTVRSPTAIVGNVSDPEHSIPAPAGTERERVSRKGMEWMRTLVPLSSPSPSAVRSPSVFTLSQAVNNGGYPSMPELKRFSRSGEVGACPLPLGITGEGCGRNTIIAPLPVLSYHQPTSSFLDLEEIVTVSPFTQEAVSDNATIRQLLPRRPSFSSRAQPRTTSTYKATETMPNNRRTTTTIRGKPDNLILSQHAITPSLWVDDETLAQFQSQLEQEAEPSRGNGYDAAYDDQSKGFYPLPAIPPLPGKRSDPAAPSAFTHDPCTRAPAPARAGGQEQGLISQFSPDSSRASFLTSSASEKPASVCASSVILPASRSSSNSHSHSLRPPSSIVVPGIRSKFAPDLDRTSATPTMTIRSARSSWSSFNDAPLAKISRAERSLRPQSQLGAGVAPGTKDLYLGTRGKLEYRREEMVKSLHEHRSVYERI